ncbi:unnamed protein product [Rotaria sp. Silwood2]|nr:unnamed protein product [Rotaria sp. Silwood2]CAF2657437.1 unnamed protein product [Rotaria sp. Silwood2]CAF3979152.1 unnamed protein product [Rotaria sp. Silwood2]CAF4149241.1 unnamed protein product [Rotaria sp. Silwood2]
MSASATSDSNTNETTPPISEAEDMKMFQAARRAGRRNALGDLSEQFTQGEFDFYKKKKKKTFRLNKLYFLVDQPISSSEVDKMAPHFQSMSIKH